MARRKDADIRWFGSRTRRRSGKLAPQNHSRLSLKYKHSGRLNSSPTVPNLLQSLGARIATYEVREGFRPSSLKPMLEATLALVDNIGTNTQVKPIKGGYNIVNRKRGIFSASYGDLDELEFERVVETAFQLNLSGPPGIRDLVVHHARKLGAGERLDKALRARSGSDLHSYWVPKVSQLMCRPCGHVHGVETLMLASHKFHLCLIQLRVVGVEASVVPTTETCLQE